MRPQRFLTSSTSVLVTEVCIFGLFFWDNHSLSGSVGTLRELYCHVLPSAQRKLVKFGSEAISDVSVHIRRSSLPSCGWGGYGFTVGNGLKFIVDIAFVYGCVTLKPGSKFACKYTG